jgi:hypothetical protein
VHVLRARVNEHTVGHLRSTIIGDTISRILEFVGHDVLRVNHVGDWGTQFGMLIRHLKDTHPNFLADPPKIADLQEFYKASKARFDKEPDFKAQAHQEVVKLQGGDPDNLKAWQMFCDVSRADFQKLYSRLDIQLTEKGESFYNPFMPPLVEELTASGLVRESDGAMCFFIPDKPVPLMMRKSDGGFTYDTTDMAAIRYRLQTESADWLVRPRGPLRGSRLQDEAAVVVVSGHLVSRVICEAAVVVVSGHLVSRVILICYVFILVCWLFSSRRSMSRIPDKHRTLTWCLLPRACVGMCLIGRHRRCRTEIEWSICLDCVSHHAYASFQLGRRVETQNQSRGIRSGSWL